MAALTAAELQRRRELEGAPDPFPSLSADNIEAPKQRASSTRGPSPAAQAPGNAPDTEDADAFPALAPSSRNPSAPPSKPGTPAPGWGAGPRIAPPVVRVVTDTFELDQVDLSTAGKDGKRAAGLSEVFRTVSAKHKVKCEASSQPSGYTSFTLKADTQKELDRARKLLISIVSPPVTLTVNAPVSTIPAIIGPKGAFLNQIRDETGAKIDIPRRETATIAASTGNNGKANLVDSDDEEEETLPITITAAGAYAREAKRLIEEIISARTSNITQRVKDIPPHVLTFISARKAEFESLAQDHEVTVSVVGQDVHVSGHREAVAGVIEAIKASIDELNASITCIKMPMPKRQHRLLTGKAAEEILNKSKCSVQVPKADSDIEEIALWARPADLPGALAAVQQAANSQHIHSFKFPGKKAQALQIFTYLSRTGFSREVTKAHPGIFLHAPTAKDLQKESIIVDIVGDKAACEAAAKQVKEASDKLIGSTRDVEIDWLLHRAIEGKYAKKIKGFKDTQHIAIFWPLESAESSKVLIVYEPTADPKDKAASLDEVQKELLKFAKEVADVKTEVIEVDEKWHAAIKGKNGTTLNALIGADSTLAIKLGTDAAKFVPAGQTATADTIAVRGVVSDVTRAIADIHRIVEEAKNDEIDNSYSTEFQIPQEYVGRIVGAQGAAVNRLREALGIEVDFSDEDRGNKDSKDKEFEVKRKKGGASGGAKSRVTLKGRKENVEEAKKRILAQVERLADETAEVLKIPRQYHAALIGRGAKYVVRLEDKYAVKVTFPRESDESGERTTREQLKADEVLVKGGKKGVADAKKELLDAVEFEKENNNQIKFTVPSRSVPRILGKSGANINEIKEDTGAQIDVDKAEDSEGNLTNISVRGTKEAVAAAKAAILKIASEVGDETTETLQIPNRFHRTIIGSRGSGLRDLLVKCGAPADPRAQAGLCHFPRQGEYSDDVVLRGPKTIVNKIAAELKKIVDELSDRVVLGADIPAAQHKSLIGRGGQTLDALQSKHNVQVQFPGSRSYDGLGTLDNEDELKDVESANLVKVSGSKAACEAAIKDMQASVKSAPPERERPAQYSNNGGGASAVTETVEVPVKYHHAISQGGQFFRNLRSYGVNVDHSVAPPRGSAPVRPTAGAASARIDADEADPSQPGWELAPNYTDADETISTWTLKGRDQAGIDKAKEALQEALENAQAVSHVGFLTVPDRSVFPRIIGSKGSTVQRLRADSGADITVGKDDNIITLQGSEAAVLKAKELILEIINRPARGPRRDRDRDYD